MSYPERTEVRSLLYSEIQQLGFLLAFLRRPINRNFPQKTYNANFWDSKTPQDVKIDKKLRKMRKIYFETAKKRPVYTPVLTINIIPLFPKDLYYIS